MNCKNQNIYIIAEAGVNHNGNMDIAYKLIDVAAKAKADAIKFQMFYPELLCSSVYKADDLAMLNNYMLTFDELKLLKQYSEKNNLDFIVTPFDFRSLDDVIRVGCKTIKIGSGEITHIPFLEKVSSFKRDVIISTGSCYLSDVERAVKAISKYKVENIGILHCISSYPAPDNELNLKAIKTMKLSFPDCKIGYSDHSIGKSASVIALAYGAEILEKHITLDKKMRGPDHIASMDQYDFIDLIKEIRSAELMLGDGRKIPQSCESAIGRSIVANRDLCIGEIISKNDIDYKRPGTGIRPYDAEKIIGLTVKKSIKNDELIDWSHFK